MKRARRIVASVAAAAGVAAAPAVAATIVGTAKVDSLRGTAAADRIDARAGNNRLWGMGGNDALLGGPGDDVLIGGPGADVLSSGAGRDTAVADRRDKVGADCETVTGLPRPGVSIENVAVPEGDSGTTTMSFPVKLAQRHQVPVTVAFATRDGTATAPRDYAAARGTLRFAPGETSKVVTVAVVGEDEFEADETFAVVLSAPVNASLANGAATGTIRNDDRQKPRSGSYSGTISQGRPISFDVTNDLRKVANLRFRLDVHCPDVGVAVENEEISLGAVALGIDGNWQFGFTDSHSTPSVSMSVSFAGILASSSSATGTLRVDMVMYFPFATVHCSSGNVAWNAA